MQRVDCVWHVSGTQVLSSCPPPRETVADEQHLLKDWPDHWTDVLQHRLANLTEADHQQWIEEVTRELMELNEGYFKEPGEAEDFNHSGISRCGRCLCRR